MQLANSTTTVLHVIFNIKLKLEVFRAIDIFACMFWVGQFVNDYTVYTCMDLELLKTFSMLLSAVIGKILYA